MAVVRRHVLESAGAGQCIFAHELEHRADFGRKASTEIDDTGIGPQAEGGAFADLEGNEFHR